MQGTQGLHLLNGLASRGSTLYALPRILEKNGVKLTALTSKLGVPTSCLVNYTLYDNCSAVGEIAATQCGHGGKCYDEDVVPLLEQDLGGVRVRIQVRGTASGWGQSRTHLQRSVSGRIPAIPANVHRC